MLLKAENINFKYRGDKYILKDINLSVKNNEIVGIVAPSGFGKTTFAKILAGYIKPDKGEVILEGCEKKKNAFNPIQLIFQHPEKSVNPKWKMKKIINEAYEPSDEMIESMGIKKEWLNRWPSELSGGELQRFCVLRALSPETKFLIADEMTTMLDAITQAQIWNVVIDYCKKNSIGLIVISHDKDLVNIVCDRVINLEDNKKDTVIEVKENIVQISKSREEIFYSFLLQIKILYNNVYKNYAIEVYTKDGKKLGYIPRKNNKIFARLMDGGKYLYGKIKCFETDFDEIRNIVIRIYLKDI